MSSSQKPLVRIVNNLTVIVTKGPSTKIAKTNLILQKMLPLEGVAYCLYSTLLSTQIQNLSRGMRFPTMWYMHPANAQTRDFASCLNVL